MKKILLWAIGLSVAFCSCKKESAPINQNHEPGGKTAKTYAVGFNISGFTKETEGTSSGKLQTNAAAEDVIKYLSYYVFQGPQDTLGSVKTITQKSTDSGFGTITDSLAAGHYTIFFVGSTASNFYYTFTFVDLLRGTYHPALYYLNYIDFGDTFVQKLELNVTGTSTQNVELKRAVGLITVKLLDKLPADVSKVVITIGNAAGSYDLITGVGAPKAPNGSGWDERKQSFTIQDSEKGKANLEFSAYVFPFSSYSYLKVSAYNSSGALIANKPLTQAGAIQIDKNKQYIYSGYLFGNAPSTFNINVNDQWNPPVNYPVQF